MGGSARRWAAILCTILGGVSSGHAPAQEPWHFIYPEQRHLEIRSPGELPRAWIPDVPTPPTVADRPDANQAQPMSLDEALQVSLANSEVIRILTGSSATSTGRTIYDPAITNTRIDQARAAFDPSVDQRNTFRRLETPQAIRDPLPPNTISVGGDAVEDYTMSLGVTKPTVTGGAAGLGVTTNTARSDGLLLNPQTQSSVDLSYIQPLLQGAGFHVSTAPIVIARIDTERSFFQMKDSMQAMVRSVIEAYWSLVFARTNLWARQQQVDQGLESFQRAEARLRVGMGDLRDVSQARSALANFRANLISAQANLLQREAALRNILGLPPYDGRQLVPVTPPSNERLAVDWNALLRMAEECRPDLIELKLILEADHQRLLLARNSALPKLDASALYRWNGLEGRTPASTVISTYPGQFTGWELGVNFSVPLGLRESRAALREQELLLARDRANLDQGLHNAAHSLAISFRNVVLYYEQYMAFREAREAARANLENQLADYRAGRPTLYLNVLQAITDWGNNVSAEAQSLTQYNVELANLEMQTGTILETHGVRFLEERYGSIGPLGRLLPDACYPRDDRPGPNAARYQTGDQPAENAFDLQSPIGP